jgi:diacylglycerol kinase (ATP)
MAHSGRPGSRERMMPGAPANRAGSVFVIVNPAAGGGLAAEVQRTIQPQFASGACEIHETAPDVDLAPVVRAALARGVDLVVAAGGDGTISAVANGLVGSSTPLGILPLGTANVLAQELGIPLDLEGACRLLGSARSTRAIDAMQVGDRVYFTQVGVGIDALMIRDTSREQKRRFGRLAYLWTAFERLLGFQPQRFSIEVDGQHLRRRASMVVVANVGTLGQAPFRWGPQISVDDGRLDICIVRARTALDYLALAWHVLLGQFRRHRNVRYLVAERTIAIDTKRRLPVQADGEIIGETPVIVHVLRQAVHIVVTGPSDTRPEPNSITSTGQA